MRGGSQVLHPPPDVRDGGGGGGWAWLVTARGLIEAELIRGVVEEAGVVPVRLDAHDPSPGAWLFPGGNVNALVRIYVPASMLEAARLALLESGLEAEDAPDPEQHRPGRSRARTITLVVAIIAIAAVVVVAMARGTAIG